MHPSISTWTRALVRGVRYRMAASRGTSPVVHPSRPGAQKGAPPVGRPCTGGEPMDLIHVRVGFDGSRGADHADPGGPGLCHGFGSGGDHAQHRKVDFIPERFQGHRRRGITGDHEHFEPLCRQKSGALSRIAHDGGTGAGAVWNASAVAQVEDILFGQEPADGPHNGEAAEPRIEHTNWKIFIVALHG